MRFEGAVIILCLDKRMFVSQSFTKMITPFDILKAFDMIVVWEEKEIVITGDHF